MRDAAPSDALALLPLAHAFAAHSPGPPPSSDALLGVFRAALADGALYVVRAYASTPSEAEKKVTEEEEKEEREEGGEGEVPYDLAGYLLLGRNTPRTLAIRNVFVAQAHRRRGLAEAMVHAVTRACLGAPPIAIDGDADDGRGVAVDVSAPAWGTKDAVCLLVAEPEVARIYARCGFVVDLEARDAETGRSLCYVQELRDVLTVT